MTPAARGAFRGKTIIIVNMSETTKITVATALALHRGGQLDQAEAQYRHLWAESPDDPEILHLLGLLHHQRGRSQQAHEWLTKAVSLAPESPLYLSNLASVESSMGQYVQAAQHASQVLALQPAHIQGLQTLITCLLRLQRPSQRLAACHP